MKIDKFIPPYLPAIFLSLLLLHGCVANQGSVSNLLDRNKYQAALDEANNALKDDPDNKLLVYNRGRAKLKLGQFEGAIEDFTKSLQLNTNSDWSHWPFYRMGQVNRRRGNYQEAVENFTSALKFNAGWKRAVEARKTTRNSLRELRRGETKLKNKKYDEARPHFERELTKHPRSIRAKVGMGLVHLGKQQYEQANSYFRSVLNQDKDHRRAQRYQNLAKELGETEESIENDKLRSEMIPGAEQRFNELVVSENGGKLGSLRSVIEELVQVQGVDGTIEFLKEMDEKHPESTVPALAQGLIYFQEQKLPEADEMLTQAIQQNGVPDIIYLKRGLANHGRGQFEESIRDFSEVLDDNSLSLGLRHKALVNRGIAKLFLKRYDSSFSDFEQSAELQPTYPEQYFYLGYLSDTREEFNEAEAYFSKAIELDNQNVRYLDYRRKIRQELGRTEGAIEDIERMQTLLEERDPPLAYQLARLHAAQFEKAAPDSVKKRESLTSSISNLRFCLDRDYVSVDVIEQDEKLEAVVSTSRYRQMVGDV